MTKKTIVQIIGTPVACQEGFKDIWRAVAEWASEQLKNQFGDSVEVVYYDLFDPLCPPLPAHAQLPLVLVNGEVVTTGGKISIPIIRKRLEVLGIETIGSQVV